MGCLNDFLCGTRTIIGIRDYDECNIPESGLYINDIPGISLKIASKIANEEFHTGAILIQKRINIATKLVFDEFSQEIAKYFDFSAVIETRDCNRFNETLYPAANLDRGLILKRWRSEMAQIYIQEIYIKVDTTQAGVVVSIVDGDTTTNFTVDLVANVTYTLFANYTAVNEQVKILINNNLFQTYGCDCLTNKSSCGSCSGGPKGFFITGWDGTNETVKCFGLSVNASVRCYEENVICALIPRMYFILWYKSGIEFLNEYINSDRLNNVTLFTKDRAKELREELEIEYKVRYSNFIKSIYNFLKSTKGECVVCNGNKYIETHP